MNEQTERLSAPPRYLDPGSAVSTLVEATSRALRGIDCGDLAQPSPVNWFGNQASDQRRAVSLDQAHEIDAEAVARWIVEQYRGRSYSAVVVGSRHGSAAHLATALGVPWLPTGFETDVSWPGGCAADADSAMTYGMAAGLSALSVNHGVLIRQVHDPVSTGAMAGYRVNLHVRWRELPEAYRAFFDRQLDPGASALIFRDVRPWPVLDLGGDYSFQVGSVVSGLDADEYLSGGDLGEVVARAGPGRTWRAPHGSLQSECGELGVEPGVDAGVRRWARVHGGRAYSVLYNGSETLSAAVADIHREWLRQHGKSGNRLVVETGRLLDPRQMIRAGCVPYWCETGTRDQVEAAEFWVAASEPFTSIDVFPEPPGNAWSRVATREQWSSVARFARRRGVVDAAMARAFPLRRLTTRQATQALRAHPYDLPEPAPLSLEAAISGLRASASHGLLVSFSTGD